MTVSDSHMHKSVLKLILSVKLGASIQKYLSYLIVAIISC
jgi:hypothetical protein